MCGIAGILYTETRRPVSRPILKAMGDSIAHRGPDAEGYLIDPGLGLVHRRLSIIDLEGGDQPIGNEDGSVQVVFNGEIYNHQSLRTKLEARGHKFQTRSDTEVLVHLYEDHGEDLIDQLRGMFAFALWDRRSRRLLLARDRLGIKPLYVYRDAEKLLFGSELKAILAYPDVPRVIDPKALEDYLTFGVVPGPRSIFQGISKLLPAHLLSVSSDHPRSCPRRYWQLRIEPDEQVTPEEWQDAIREKLLEVVRDHLIADVPVGAFLSGGLDSSLVVASSAGVTREPLQTFSMGFREESYCELPYARQIAEQFGTRHAEEVVTADAASLLDELTHFFDEPFADSSAIPTFLVSRLASRSVKVVLSGDGGDEAFGGYARYAHDLREAALRQRIPRWIRRGALGTLSRSWPKADWLPRPLRAKTLLSNLSMDPGPAYVNTLSRCRPPMRRRLIAPDLVGQLNGHDPGQVIGEAFASTCQDMLGSMISADVAMMLPDDYLVKVDRASMANGLEVRPPLLDHEFMELAARIPSRWKIRYGETKWILKQVSGSMLPAAIRDRPKHGFEIPLNEWFRGPLRPLFESKVLNRGGGAEELIDQDMARRLLRSHLAGTGRHGEVLWSLLVLATWADRHIRTNGNFYNYKI